MEIYPVMVHIGYSGIYFDILLWKRYCYQYLMSGFEKSNLFESGIRLPESS